MAIRKLITGMHSIIYSRKPEADRLFLRDVLGLRYVDVGDDWLIFALPPSELAVHPAARNDKHEIYFTCADVEAFMAAMEAEGIDCDPVQHLSWGKLIRIGLPGGGKLGVYEPLHIRPQRPRTPKAGKGR
jgi:catechol 2,3-dioxygenase-like lactoylglutathione lyase family enzyme